MITPALMELARLELEEFEETCDREFLERLELDKRLQLSLPSGDCS